MSKNKSACRFCGSTNDPYFSRVIPMAYVCTDCGKAQDSKPQKAPVVQLPKREVELLHELEDAAKVIRRLVNYADKVAMKHPKAVTIPGQNARAAGGLWLASFDRRHGKKIPNRPV